MKYPEFIIAGVVKGGTSALWYNLDKHPDINMVRKGGGIEMMFWKSRFYKKGHDWYKSFFNDDRLGGEKSPSYYVLKQSMREISKYIPNCKIILCLRNPVDRAYSNYQMNSKSGRIGTPFTFDVFKKRYSNPGRYMTHIKNNILPFFNEDQIHICVMEHMKKDMKNKMGEVFEFLGVYDLGYKSKEIDGILRRTRTREEDVALSRKQKFYRVWTRHKGVLTGELRNQILDYYKPQNQMLFDFLGYEIEEWKK